VPKALDLKQLTVTHSPTQRIDFATSKLGIPQLDISGMIDNLLGLIEGATGVDLSSLQPLLDVLSEIPAALGALARGDWESLVSLIPGFNPTTAAQQFITAIVQPFVQLLFKLIRPEWLPELSLGSIGSSTPNLLLAGMFDSADTISGGGIWSWVSSGVSVPGSVQVIADGAPKQLFSNEIPVSSGQKLSPSVQAKWSGLVATGTPIVLSLVTYAGHAADSTATDLDTVVLDTTGTGSDGGWEELSAAYTIPDGVDEVRLRLAVAATATAGTVQFDDAAVKKTGLLNIGFVGGLQPILDGLQTAVSLVQAGVDEAKQLTGQVIDAIISVIRGIPFIGGTLADLLDHLTSWRNDTNATAVVATAATGIGVNAQGSADTANSDLVVVKSILAGGAASGVSGSDTFDGASSSDLLPRVTQVFFASGAGAYGRNGSGQAVWIPSGGSPRGVFNLYNDVGDRYVSDNQVSSVRLVSKVVAGGGFFLTGRMNAAGTTGIYVSVDAGSVQPYYYLSGVQTAIGSPTAYTSADGEVWELTVGTTADATLCVMRRNSTIVKSFNVPGGHPSGASYRVPAFAAAAGGSFFGQLVPPAIDVFAFADHSG
jgi:hypothetical protein